MKNPFIYDYSKIDTAEFRKYMDTVFQAIRRKEVECILEAKFHEARKKVRVVRKPADTSVFKPRAFITPDTVELVTDYGVPVRFRIVCNSAIRLVGDKAGIFLRLGSIGIFPLGCRLCRTFVAYTEIKLDELRGVVRVKAKPVLLPLLSSECVEDPRVDPENPNHLYHVRGHYLFWHIYGMDTAVLTFCAKLEDSTRVKTIEPIVFEYKGEYFILRDFRDSFPISKRCMALRPWLERLDTGGFFVGARDDTVVDFKTVEAVPELLPTEYEKKSGGNCAVKISSNEYLVLLHGVDNHYGMYYHYAALFSEAGELLAVSEKPVISPGIGIYSGTRPATVFACGIVKHGNTLLVTAGKDDEILVIYEAELDKVIEAMKFLKG